MKTKLTGIALAFTLGFVVIAMAQSQSSNNQPASSTSSASAAAPASNADASTHSAAKPTTTKPAAKKGLTPDQAYKANCTRCHAELPTMDVRRTKTIVRHMRVRANLTEREAQAIFEYLNK
jgi:hypothetical protein